MTAPAYPTVVDDLDGLSGDGVVDPCLDRSVTALLRSWPLADCDRRRASALTARVAATADRSGRGLMSMSLTPHERSLRVTVDDHGEEHPRLTVHTSESAGTTATFVIARQRDADERPQPADDVLWFSLTVEPRGLV